MSAENLSQTDLAILDCFTRPTDAHNVSQWAMWNYGGTKRPNMTERINTFLSLGLLRSSTPEERLGDIGVPRLKEELKARSAAFGGNKPELVRRLESLLGPGEAETLLDGPAKLSLTEAGSEAIATAAAADDARYQLAMSQSLAALVSFDLTTAHKVRASYIASRGGAGALSPRSFTALTPPPELSEFRCLANVKPDSLDYLEPRFFGELVVAGAMHWLWNEPPEGFLSADCPSAPLAPVIAGKHLRSAARISGERQRVRNGKPLRIEAGFPNTACSECIDLVGKTFAHDAELPSLPLRGCFAEAGCDLRIRECWDNDEDDYDDDGFDDATSPPPATRAPILDPAQRLQQARQLLEQGLIDETDYEDVKQAVLRELRGE